MVDTAFQPDWFSKPGDTLLTLMEQLELTSESLAKKIDRTDAIVRGLLAGTIVVDESLAKALSKHVGGTSDYWLVRQAKYQTALAKAADVIPHETADQWIKEFPHSDMRKNGWIKPTMRRSDLVREYLSYFGVNNPTEWENRYTDFLKNSAFRTSPTFKSKIGALSIWLRQGEIEAAQLQCAPWNPKALKSRIDEIRVLCKAKNPAYFLPRLRRICADVGIAIVFVSAPSGCAASGVARFVAPNKALVILSFRYLSDDHFWFTLFHEIGHLLLHNENPTFIDSEDGVESQMEKEANDFSERTLIPTRYREKLLDLKPNKESVIRFAYSIGVSSGIVVGQLQHHNVLGRQHLNFLKRRFSWHDIQLALS